VIAYIRSLDPKGAMAGAAATLVLVAGIVLGSSSFRHFDPVLVTYAFGVLISAFTTAYRTAVWLQRPPTRTILRRGFLLLLQGSIIRNLVYVARLLGTTFAAQRFIRKRSFLRWLAHFLLAWGTMIAVAITFPLVFGWLHFASRMEDPGVYRILLFGLAVGEFRADSVLSYLVFNLLNISALMVITGAGVALHRRFREPAALSRQQFGNDIVPLLLLLAISLTGLALTFSSHFMRGAGYAVLSLVHALTVSITLVYLPFGKLFHIFQRPLHLAVLLRRRGDETATQAICGRCGTAFAGAAHLEDLKTALRETGHEFNLDFCPRCRRRRLGRAQSVAIKGVQSDG
jgi:hypothetical protein